MDGGLTLLSPALSCPLASQRPELETRRQLTSPVCCSRKNCRLAVFRSMTVEPSGMQTYCPHGVHPSPEGTLPVQRTESGACMWVGVSVFGVCNYLQQIPVHICGVCCRAAELRRAINGVTWDE